METKVDLGINRVAVRVLGALVPALLGIIGFFVLQVLAKVNQIADDNQRFNTYIITSTSRIEGIESDVEQLKKDVKAQGQKHAEDWAEFWRNYAALLPRPTEEKRISPPR